MKNTQCFLVFILLLAFAKNGSTQCPTSWLHNGNSCYHVSRDEESWVEAMRMCEIHKSQLVHIETYQEQQYLTKLLSNNSLDSDVYWTAGSDWSQEGVWVWEKQGINVTYENWDRTGNQPDNAGGNEHCMVMRREVNFRWVDEFCSDDYFYICERPAISGFIFG